MFTIFVVVLSWFSVIFPIVFKWSWVIVRDLVNVDWLRLFFRLIQFTVLLSYMKQLGQISGDNNLHTQASFRSKIQKLKIYTILLDKTRPLQPSETSLSYWIQFVAFSFPYHMHWMPIFCCPFADGGIIGVEQKRVSTSEFFQIITGAPTKQVGL